MLKKYNFNRLKLYIGLMMFLIVMRDIIHVNIPDIILVITSTTAIYKLPYKQAIPFLFFLFPLTCGIPGYIMFISYVILIYKRKRISSSQTIPIFIIFSLEILNESFRLGMNGIVGLFSFLSFCALFFFFLNDNKYYGYDIKTAIFYFCMGTAFTFFVIFYNAITQYGIIYILAGFARSGALGIESNDVEIMQGHLAMNANTVAYYSICCTSCLIVLFNYFPKYKVIWLLSIIMISGFLTLSRTYILCLSFFVVLYIFLAPIKFNKYFIGFICAVVLILLIFGIKYFDIFFEAMSLRSSDANTATAGGRTLLFIEYNHAWLSSIWYIIFGTGVIDYYPYLGCHNAMHSGLQQIWVCLGLVGFILFTQQIITFFRRYQTSIKICYIIPFFITFLFDQSIQFLNPYPFMLPILVTLLVPKYIYLTTHKRERIKHNLSNAHI